MQKRDAWYSGNVHACISESISCCAPIDAIQKRKRNKKADIQVSTTASCNAIIARIKGIVLPHYSPPLVSLATINNPACSAQSA